MSLKTEVTAPDELSVQISPTRHDVIHPCDIYEDVAIGYGYNNIKKTIPKTPCIGKEVSIFTLKHGYNNIKKSIPKTICIGKEVSSFISGKLYQTKIEVFIKQLIYVTVPS